MVKANIDFASFEEDFLQPLNTGQTFSLDFWWRGDTNSLTRVQVDTVGVVTFSQLAGLYCQKLLEVFGTSIKTGENTEGQRRLVYIGIRATGSIPIVASQLWKADELMITVSGKSFIQVQNRTPGVNTTVAPVELIDQTDSIFANPLRGQYYTFKNGRPSIKSPGTTSATQLADFVYDFAGVIAVFDERPLPVAPATGPSKLFDESVTRIIRKPPPGRLFNNCVSTKPIQLNPGQIGKSTISHTVKKSLAAWMYALTDKMRACTTKTFAGLTQAEDPQSYRIGQSHIYGLEKMCDTEIGSIVGPRVGIEHNLYMSAHVVLKRKQGIIPQVAIETT